MTQRTASTDRDIRSDPASTYATGVAARLAGIPVETLRVWERRYRIVGPKLNARGHRLYSAEDVSRLALIRQLVDLGSPIGSIATLSLAALRDMRSAAAAASHGLSTLAPSTRPVRVAIVGTALAGRLVGGSALHEGLDIVATASKHDDPPAFKDVTADVIAVEIPTLQREALAQVDAWVQAAGAQHAIIAYRFAPAAVIGALRDRGYIVVRAPLEVDALVRLSRDAVALDASHVAEGPRARGTEWPVAPRFDDASLTQVSRALTTLSCECPRHVVELLQSLGTFERYSADCANRSPADAVLHRHLQRVAGAARVLFEDALVRVAAAEGLALTAPAQSSGSTS